MIVVRLPASTGKLALAHDTTLGRYATAVGKDMGQVLGWFLAEHVIQIGQVGTKQPFKITDRVFGVIVAEPPEPVRALTDGQLVLGRQGLITAQTALCHDLVKDLLGIAQHVPATVLVRVADPC